MAPDMTSDDARAADDTTVVVDALLLTLRLSTPNTPSLTQHSIHNIPTAHTHNMGHAPQNVTSEQTVDRTSTTGNGKMEKEERVERKEKRVRGKRYGAQRHRDSTQGISGAA